MLKGSSLFQNQGLGLFSHVILKGFKEFKGMKILKKMERTWLAHINSKNCRDVSDFKGLAIFPKPKAWHV